MKYKIKMGFPILLLLAIFSCKNQAWDFPDYKFSSTYFPYQTPVRTLELGDDLEFNNSSDQKLQFSIGVAMGGLYNNGKDCKVGYVLDETLTRNLYTSAGDTLVPLPQAYYTLSPTGTMVIPKGSMQGYIDVQLKDAFLDDPRAFTNRYVVPLRLTSTETDSILSGFTLKSNPDRRIATDWTIVPKDYTLYEIKFINPYHGHFLYRGKDVLSNADGTKVDEVVYRNKYVEKNDVVMMTTTGRTQVGLTNMIRMSAGSPGNFSMLLDFDNNGNCIVKEKPGSPFLISGTGKFVKEGDEWGGKKRNTITLSYNYSALFTPTPPPPVIVNDAEASITYTGAWTSNAEAGCYKSDRHYSSTPSDFFTFKFTGVAVALYFKTGSYGTFDVYLDDMSTPIATNISAAAPSTNYQVKLFEKTGLTNSEHTIKCVIKQSINVIFDYYTFTPAPKALPPGIYKHSVNDTLVIRDRAVVLESFAPVIK